MHLARGPALLFCLFSIALQAWHGSSVGRASVCGAGDRGFESRCSLGDFVFNIVCFHGWSCVLDDRVMIARVSGARVTGSCVMVCRVMGARVVTAVTT